MIRNMHFTLQMAVVEIHLLHSIMEASSETTIMCFLSQVLTSRLINSKANLQGAHHRRK